MSVKPSVGSSINTGNSLAANLVGAWLCNENTGLTTADGTANANTGTFASIGAFKPTWGTDDNGDACIVFAKGGGTLEEYVDLGSTASMNMTGAMSALVRVMIDVLPTAGNVNCTIFGSSDNSSSFIPWRIAVSSAGKITVSCNEITLTGTTVLATGVWHQIGFSRTGSSGSWTYTVYLDGVQEAQGSTATNPIAQRATSFGRLGAFSGSYAEMHLTTAFLWTRGLSAGEFSSLNSNLYAFYVSITLAPSTIPNLDVNQPYSQSITASGGTGPYTFATTAGTLPTGLVLTTAGLLSGTPTAAGAFSFTITATDANSATGHTAYSNTVYAQLLLIAPQVLPNATHGVAYTQTVVSVGGHGTDTFTLTGGTLPSGITLSSTGVLSGTP